MPPKHRKIYRDNIHGVTNPAIKRLAHRAGIKVIGGDTYESVRNVIINLLDKIIKDSITFVSYDRRRTVQRKDVRRALLENNLPLL